LTIKGYLAHWQTGFAENPDGFGSEGNKRRQWAAMIYPGEGKKGQPKAGDYVLAAEQARAEAAASPHQFTAVDLASADRWEAQARTKQLPSTRTEIGAGGELIDREDRWDELGVVNTVADPDYVTASASRERLELANEAGSLDLALDVADSIQAQDSLEKMLVHEMAVLHRGMMRAATRMNEELYAATGRDEGRREAANVRACRLAGAISRLSATYQQALLTLQRKRTGGSQHVTVKHIHQQVNVTEGGQAVVAGDKVTSRAGGRRGIAKAKAIAATGVPRKDGKP
jgi:hypothetical protein